MIIDNHSEENLRIQTFKDALALCLKALNEGRLNDARYWLNGASVLFEAIDNTVEDLPQKLRVNGL